MKASDLSTSNMVEELEAKCEEKLERRLDGIEEKAADFQVSVQRALSVLTPLQRDILEAYAYCDDDSLDAATLGIELGEKHSDGPIPAGTIRVYKLRAKDAFHKALIKNGIDVSNLGVRR